VNLLLALVKTLYIWLLRSAHRTDFAMILKQNIPVPVLCLRFHTFVVS